MTPSWNWLAVGIVATIVGSGAPLILAEVSARSGKSADGSVPSRFHRSHRRLRVATVAVWAAFAVWFSIDRAAVAAGQRPFMVAIANVLAFALLFFAFTARIMFSPRQERGGLQSAARASSQTSIHKPLAEYLAPREMRAAQVFVGVALVLGCATLVASRNGAGYQLKAALMFVAGAAFFFLGFQRLRRPSQAAAHNTAVRLLLAALGYFCVFAVAAILTLTLDWNIASRRWLGVGSQVAAGVLGLVGCARMLVADAESQR